MSDLMRALIKSLMANGVKVPADEPVCLGGEKVSPAYNLDAIILDFSEHDKVFEDKIAELKKDYKTVSGLLSTYQQENESLKQRIAELESKETEKPKKRTEVIVAREIDGQIYVTLDDFMSVVNDFQAEIGT